MRVRVEFLLLLFFWLDGTPVFLVPSLITWLLPGGIGQGEEDCCSYP